MMNKPNQTNLHIINLAFIVLMSSCSVKWIADYDADIAKETVAVAKQVDSYYADLISITNDNGNVQYTDKLTKSDFDTRAKKIDNELYGLVLRNQARPLNKLSTNISTSILEKFWRKYEGDLGTKPALLGIHRSNFARNFEALLKGEETKNNN